ncbi:ATP-binding protein [Streptomyces aurantiacus]|uniref:ATP-binding protein n=1 Tax=Streptomyces aurantiacus TaxID=47760 RepID=UPI001FE14AFC|nr:AAA family ATPase [Streptomyces aurantiacus]
MRAFAVPENWTAAGRPGNLPSETRSFVGRRHELARLDALLKPAGDYAGEYERLVTLVGPGGVGKTRLALRAARRACDRYRDGVWFVELSPLRAPGLVGFAVVEALRLADGSTSPVTEVLAEWLADKEALIVLDSCEHVLHDCADLVRALLPAAPGVQFLATTREHLGHPSEVRVEVAPLPVREDAGPVRPTRPTRPTRAAPVREAPGPAGPVPGDLDGSGDAVDLFINRAGELSAGFALDEASLDTVAAVAAVCRRLDGIPLAIELAAARLSELSLGELDERLGKRLGRELSKELSKELSMELGPRPDKEWGDPLPSPLDLLASEPGEGPLRHRTLRTAIGWSHELCAPLERLLWARLSVFNGGFDLAAAEEVCSGGPLPAGRVAALLDRLVAQSIVRRHRTDAGRFHLLDSVREYGGDWLRALGEERALRLRHLDHYRGLARSGCAEWNTSRQVLWCERTVTERANLRTAMDCALSERDGPAALSMAADIGFLWRHCGYLRDARHCLDQVLTADPEPGPDLVQALWTRGAVALLQGDLDGAGRWAPMCTAAAVELGDPVAVVAAAYVTGGHLLLVGRLAEAKVVLRRAERLPVRDDWRGSAQLQVRLALSFAHLLSGDRVRSRQVADEVRAQSVRRGECWAGSFADCFLAQADLDEGDLPAAVRNARTSLVGHSLLNSTLGVAFTLDVLASAVVATGDGHRAARLLAVGQRIWERLGSPHMDSPDLIAARRDREHLVRREIGEEAYRTAYAEGLAMSYERGIDYAVGGAL